MKTQFKPSNLRHDYAPGMVSMPEVERLEDFLVQHRPEWSMVRWISIVGLSNMHAIHALATKYDLHPLDLPCRGLWHEFPPLSRARPGMGIPGVLADLHRAHRLHAAVFPPSQLVVSQAEYSLLL